jgi:hypothetical protein
MPRCTVGLPARRTDDASTMRNFGRPSSFFQLREGIRRALERSRSAARRFIAFSLKVYSNAKLTARPDPFKAVYS